MGLLDIFRRKKSGIASPSTDSKRGDWMKWFLNREGLGGMKFNPDPGGYIDYSPFFQKGGSVNPHEETLQAGRSNNIRRNFTDLVPDVSTRPAEPLHPVFPGREPGEGIIKPGKNRHGTEFFGWGSGAGEGSFWNVKSDQPWQDSGIMTADAGNVMNKYKQFTEKFGDFDIGRDGIEYEKDFDVPWGGTGTFEGWGGGDDYGAGINFNWPLGQSAALDGGIGSTDEYQMAELTQDQKNYMRNPYFSPGLPGAPTADELFNQVKEREDKGFFGWGAQEPTTRPEFDEYYDELQGSFYA